MEDSMSNRETDPWIEITWSDLRDWAGRETVARGKRYQENGRVVSLGRLSPSRLQATVRGSDLYDVRVSMTSGQLQSECSCPVGTMCKHAVATVLEYLHCLENRAPVPDVPCTEVPRANGNQSLARPDGPTDRSKTRPSRPDEEAVVSLKYGELVDRLIEAGRLDEAKTWIRRGWESTWPSVPGIALRLRNQLAAVWKKERNQIGLACLAAEEFFDRTDVESYLAFRKAARTAGVWDSCQGPIRDYLLTGRQPEASDWPLAPTGFALEPGSFQRRFLEELDNMEQVRIFRRR
jgi:uncharacterized Zn finger protein